MHMRTRTTRVAIAAVTAITAGFALTACGSSSKPTTLASLKKAGKVVVGINGEDPYSYKTKGGQLTGATIALDRAVYKQLGVKKIVGKQVDWDSLIPGLNAGQFDEVSAGMSILPDRCKQAAFSDPEITYETAFLVPKGNPKHLKTMQDLKKKHVNLVTENGAVEQGYAQKMGLQTQTVGSPEDGLKAVESGQADAFALTAISLRSLVKTQPGAAKKVSVTPAFTAVVNGKLQVGAGAAVFRKGDTSLIKAYNQKLDQIINNPKKFNQIVGKFGFTEKERPHGKYMNTKYLCSGKLPSAK